jgi:hypothetical protein
LRPALAGLRRALAFFGPRLSRLRGSLAGLRRALALFGLHCLSGLRGSLAGLRHALASLRLCGLTRLRLFAWARFRLAGLIGGRVSAPKLGLTSCVTAALSLDLLPLDLTLLAFLVVGIGLCPLGWSLHLALSLILGQGQSGEGARDGRRERCSDEFITHG